MCVVSHHLSPSVSFTPPQVRLSGCTIYLWRLSGLGSRAPKIRRSLRAKENVGYDCEQEAVDDQLKQRVKGAEDDVQCDPNEQKPARPVAAAKHKDATKNREQPQKENPDHAICKRALSHELRGVVCKSDKAGCYEQATDDSD